MGGEGAMAGMNISRKNNRSLLSRSRQHKRDAFERVMNSSKLKIQKTNRKRLSEDEIEKIRIKYRRKKKKADTWMIVGIIFFLIGCGVLIFFFLNFLEAF